MDALSVSIDTAQTRILHDRVSTLVTGEDWSRRFASNVYVEPVTKAAMLTPLPLTPEWTTTGSGDYRRYGLSDYTLTAANWRDDPNTGTLTSPIDHYITGVSATGDNSEVVVTRTAQPRNGAMYLSWFGANAGTDDMVAIECGWGTYGDCALSLRFYAGGKVDVYRYNVYADTYTIQASQQGTNPQAVPNQFVSVLLMPFRRRELLIVSNKGGGAVHLLDDLDPNDADPEVTPSLPFWWKVPSGLAKVSCAPCKFKTSGYVCGTKSYFASAPQSSQTFEGTAFRDDNGGGAVASLCQPDDPTSSWAPNGTDSITRVKVALTGNGVRTPNVYAATCAFKTSTAQTPDTPTPLDAYLTKASLEVPDNASDLRWSIELKAPDAVDAAGAANIRTGSNRPIGFSLGPIAITKGVTESPRLVERVDDTSSRVSIEVRDKWKLCERYLFTDPTPLDGLNIIDAFRLVLNAAGIPNALLDLEATPFTLPSADTPSKGQDDFAVLIRAGDTAADWLNRLHEDYCATWMMGWTPTASGWKFRLVSPANLPTTSALTLYATVGDAIAAGAANPNLSDHTRHTYRSYDQHTLEPEANDVWVIGRDPRTGKPIVGHKADAASQDPTVAVASRPANWLGEVRKYGLYDACISSEDAVGRCVQVLYDRLTPRRTVAEFTSDFLIKPDGTPLWRGDVVTLDGKGDYRIKSLSAEFVREPDNSPTSTYWRPTKYVAELIADASQGMTNLHGFTLAQVVASHDLKSMSKSVIRSDDVSRGLVKQKPLMASVY